MLGAGIVVAIATAAATAMGFRVSVDAGLEWTWRCGGLRGGRDMWEKGGCGWWMVVVVVWFGTWVMHGDVAMEGGKGKRVLRTRVGDGGVVVVSGGE